MDQQRGRSPSTGRQQSHINQNPSPSPHQFQDNINDVGIGLGLDNQNSSNQQYSSGAFIPNNGLSSYSDSNNLFLNQSGQSFSQSGLGNPSFDQAQDFDTQFKQESQPSFAQQQQSSYQELLASNVSPNFNEGDFSLYSTPSGQDNQFEQSFFVNEAASSSVNPAQLDMASPQTHTPTPPHLLQPNGHSPSSAHQSPSFNSGQFQHSPAHSRHTSLGPESAAFPQGQVDWSMMAPQFQGHRRTPSEYSDVSVSSAAHSPNMAHLDAFEPVDQRNSPMQNAQDASLYNEVLSIGTFSLSDPQIQHGSSPGRGISPAHSPAISPRLLPQQMPNVNQQNSFMLGMGNGFIPTQNPYGQPPHDALPQIHHGQGSLDMGQAQQMVPPEINVEFAPASRQNSFEPPKPSLDQDALTPPDRGSFRTNSDEVNYIG